MCRTMNWRAQTRAARKRCGAWCRGAVRERIGLVCG
jgi:hypothetical protein